MEEKMVRFPGVVERVGLKRTAIYDGIKAGTFPAPVRIGKRAVAWPSSAIQKWIDERMIAAKGA